LFGTATNRDFLIDVLGQKLFADGGATTAFIEEVYGAAGWSAGTPSNSELAVVGLIEHALGQQAAFQNSSVSRELLDWSSARDLETVLQFGSDKDARRVSVRPDGSGGYRIDVDGEIVHAAIESFGEDRALLSLNDSHCRALFWKQADGRLFVALPTRSFSVIESAALAGAEANEVSDGIVCAPMHGQLLEVLVAIGDRVVKGDKLAVLEAMKMQHEILAEATGTVISVVAEAGTQIAADARILEIELDADMAPDIPPDVLPDMAEEGTAT
jgi:geranyl-CoA carboxylase alpha subunit